MRIAAVVLMTLTGIGAGAFTLPAAGQSRQHDMMAPSTPQADAQVSQPRTAYDGVPHLTSTSSRDWSG